MNNEKSLENRIVEKIKSVNNILVTVGTDPSIDGLAAALGLALALDKFGKHTSTVFSGKIPRSINFLNPGKVFVDNADALRDFIISLSKDKADRLRFKPEGDVVKIYITPYKTKISAEDLTFSDGDFNVELILALDVDGRDELDKAIASQSRVFHDATTVILNAAGEKSTLGEINWTDDSSNSYAEIIAKLIPKLTPDKDFIDEQISTALLTGVVSATNQFRNAKTTPATMTTAANLMARGANQQLITSELASANNRSSANPIVHTDLDINHDDSIGQTNDKNNTAPTATPLQPATPPITQSEITAERDKYAEQNAKAAEAVANVGLNQILPTLPTPSPNNNGGKLQPQQIIAMADSNSENKANLTDAQSSNNLNENYVSPPSSIEPATNETSGAIYSGDLNGFSQPSPATSQTPPTLGGFNLPLPPPLPPMPSFSIDEDTVGNSGATLADDPRLANLNDAAANFANSTENQTNNFVAAQHSFTAQPIESVAANGLPPVPPLEYAPAPTSAPAPDTTPTVETKPAPDPSQFQIPGM